MIGARLLTDPWALHLLDFVEQTRADGEGPRAEENHEKIWVRESGMPACDDPNKGDELWESSVLPLLKVPLCPPLTIFPSLFFFVFFPVFYHIPAPSNVSYALSYFVTALLRTFPQEISLLPTPY